MQPDPARLIESLELNTPLIGFYDAPDTAPFEPLCAPTPGKRACLFAFSNAWLDGKTLHLTRANHGCGGAGSWLFDVKTRTREEYIRFLVDDEGLKDTHELMGEWIDAIHPYKPEHGNILIGPLLPGQHQFLKTVTFLVNPDQLSLLITGAQYHASPADPAPTIAPFGSGCMQLVTSFQDLDVPQAVIGATDIAMRQYLPPDMLAFTVTVPMFERLCSLDERSFFSKPFLKRVRSARGSKESRSIGN